MEKDFRYRIMITSSSVFEANLYVLSCRLLNAYIRRHTYFCLIIIMQRKDIRPLEWPKKKLKSVTKIVWYSFFWVSRAIFSFFLWLFPKSKHSIFKNYGVYPNEPTYWANMNAKVQWKMVRPFFLFWVWILYFPIHRQANQEL